MRSKTGVSLSPSPVEVLYSNPSGIQGQIPWDSQSLYWIPRPGSLTRGSKSSQQWENFFGIIVLQSVGHPPGGCGILFDHNCAPPTILLQLLFCPGRGVSFVGGFQHSPVLGCSTASCDFGALADDEHTSFYSTILNWKMLLEAALISRGCSHSSAKGSLSSSMPAMVSLRTLLLSKHLFL